MTKARKTVSAAAHAAQKTRLDACVEDNCAKTQFIAKQELTIRFLRDDTMKQHALVLQLQKRLAELEKKS
jgi:hypothetical protein